MGAFKVFRHNRSLPLLFAWIAVLAVVWPLAGQSPNYGVGRQPTAEEVRAWDIAIGPDGDELPMGEGTAAEGKQIYQIQCAECHGSEGQGSDQGGALVGGQGTLTGSNPVKTVGSYWPYATTLWDYINRSMPFYRPGTLTDDQVYSVVALILHLNGIVGENEVMNAETLPGVEMPNRNGFVSDPRPDIGLTQQGRTR